jgi:glutamate N-acetyltransferase/amino-acid N-acetyltransferase
MAGGWAPPNGGFSDGDPDRLSVAFDGTRVFVRGVPTGHTPTLEGAVCRIDVDLGAGDGRASYLASDLSYDYVRINAEYTT